MRLSTVLRGPRSLYGPYYAGRKGRSSSVTSSIAVRNPANGEVISEVTTATSEDVQLCVEKAKEAFDSGVWSKSSCASRSKALSKLARLLESRVPEFAELDTLQTGRTIREMRAQHSRLPEWLDYFASLIRVYQGYVAPTFGNLHNFVQRVPLGVVAQITPFNHPLFIAMKKIAPALAAGNSVIVKPSELAPLSVLEFVEMAGEAGIPDGVLSVLTGPGSTVGKELVSHPLLKKIDVTGGTRAGKDIGKIVGFNLAHYTAELGGKAPIIVFKDADIPTAVNGVAFASFIASGQTCVSGTRLIIADEIYDTFMERFLAKVEAITGRMGNPMNTDSSMGTIISRPHLERIQAMISRSSGRILAGGSPMTEVSPLDGYDLAKGCFYPPTVISGIGTQDELWTEEIFGPVVVVQKFRNDKVAIQLANDCKYGLGAAVWTSSINIAHWASNAIAAGLVWVNTHHRNDPSSPWGGMKDSGVGRENGIEALESYSQSKSIIMSTASPAEALKDDWFDITNQPKRYG